MRTFLRTTLITTLVVFSALLIWSWLHPINATQTAQAATGLNVPAYCIPPELAGINDLLSKTTNAEARNLLLAKKQDAENGALECARNATAHPPAKKPKNPVRVEALPTNIPGPTATIQAGIQHGNLIPAPPSRFIPLDDGNNLWEDRIAGKLVSVFAGYMRDDNWQDHPDWPIQGAVVVWLNDLKKKGGEYPTPTQHGIVHFIAACGTKLFLQATDGTVFVFDAAAQAYVETAPACPTVTPQTTP
jgi:hypothetical protein